MKLEVMNHSGNVMITAGLGIRDSTASTLEELIQKVDEQNLAIKANAAAIAKLNERVEGDRRLARREVLNLQNAVNGATRKVRGLKEIFVERITEVEKKTMRNDSKVTEGGLYWIDKLEEKIKDTIKETDKKVTEEVGKKLIGDWSKANGDESKLINNLDERIEEKYKEGAEEIVDAIVWDILLNRPGLLRGVSQL